MKTLIKSGLAVVALFLCLGGNAFAGKFEDGFMAHLFGNYEAAHRIWLPLAEQGDASAQLSLGLMYKKGEGVPQDYVEAMKWFRKALAQGHAGAQFALGNMYDNGQGVPQDYAEAVMWYRKAAERGVISAQFNLGAKYSNGQGVPQDYAEAVRWYGKAAEQGNASAQNNLGVMYEKGEGVPQDYVQAHRWYNLAAATHTDKADREQAASNRDMTARKMTPAQVAEAQKLAREWKPTSSISFK